MSENICIICAPRTRSTIFINAISHHYNLYNHFEPYEQLVNRKFNLSDQLKINKGKTFADKEEIRFDLYQNQVLSETESILYKNIGNSTKIFSRSFIPDLHCRPEVYSFDFDKNPKQPTRLIYNLEDYNPKIVMDVSKYFQLNKFSQLYILTRDIESAVCSFVNCFLTDVFIWNTNDVQKIQKLKQIHNSTSSVYVDPNLPWIKFYIFEMAFLNTIEQYFIDKKLPYSKLNYNEIPLHVQQNYKDYQMEKDTVDTKFDYSKLIANYNELRDFASKFYQECLLHIEKLQIKLV